MVDFSHEITHSTIKDNSSEESLIDRILGGRFENNEISEVLENNYNGLDKESIK